jgi:3-deoxy-D-manno-octulosonic-acid transferase
VYLIYSFALAVALALYLPFYAFRMKVLKKDRVHLRERMALGMEKRPEGRDAVWIHAVSVGEVLSLQNLIRELKRRHPEWDIVFSTLTHTGIKMAREKLKEADRVFFVPLDFRRVIRRVFRAVRPGVLVLAESEFWPNLVGEAADRGLKVLLINGRISDHTFKVYEDIRPIARRILGNIDRFLVQTDEDREKLERLGIEPGRLEVAGNLKSEVRLPVLAEGELREFKRSLGLEGGEKVVVAGSTRKGEEDRLLKAFAEARKKRPGLRFVVAPRHVERAGEIEKAAQWTGFTIARRTRMGPGDRWDVLILDTIGELARVYALSDAAFVGGSLVDWGGHNILEPAFYGRPVFFGPHMQNFARLADSFIRAGGARIVRTDPELADMFLLEDTAALGRMGERARAHLASLGGATERTIRAIEWAMGKSGPGPDQGGL